MVQYPYERHGHVGKPSHTTIIDAKKDYLMFVDLNPQPNGCSTDSTSATHFIYLSSVLFKHQRLE